LTLFSAVLIFFGFLPHAVSDPVTEPGKQAPSQRELAERCRAALRDLRTFCAPESHFRSLPLPPERLDLRETQQTPRRPPGAEYPELPRRNEQFECLDARLRVDRYCFQEDTDARENVVSCGEPPGPSV
jgi:hypothetical protein